jgi:hypothetical protein
MVGRRDSGQLAAALTRHRWSALIGVGVVALAISALAVFDARHNSVVGPSGANLVPITALSNRPFFLFRSTALNKDYGTMELAPEASDQDDRAMTSLKCERVAYGGGRGICLSIGTGSLFSSTRAIVFDDRFRTRFVIPLPGYPSRTQVSRNGVYGATTDFVSGDSYTTAGFSTRTNIIDLRTGKILFGLEKMQVYRDGSRFENVNFNFWGVTFAPDNTHFYATLGSANQTYLIEGDVDTETATVLRTGVECPSLSPERQGDCVQAAQPRTGGHMATVGTEPGHDAGPSAGRNSGRRRPGCLAQQ